MYNYPDRECKASGKDNMQNTTYSELLVALENIMIDKVATVPTARNGEIDTSAAMETGMAANDDGESARKQGDQRIVDFALQAVLKGTGKGKWSFGKGPNGNEETVPWWQRWQRWEKKPWQKGSGKKGSKGHEKGGKGETRACWTCDKKHEKCAEATGYQQTTQTKGEESQSSVIVEWRTVKLRTQTDG